MRLRLAAPSVPQVFGQERQVILQLAAEPSGILPFRNIPQALPEIVLRPVHQNAPPLRICCMAFV